MAESSLNFSPFVYWGQNSDTVFLKVDIKEAKTPKISITEDDITFEATGNGCQGCHPYSFSLSFYLPVDDRNSKYVMVSDHHIDIQLRKFGAGEFWPRLTYNQSKPAWLKTDFDRFIYDDSEEELRKEAAEKEEERNIMQHLDSSFKESSLPEFSALENLSSFYLFIYNMFMWVGFTAVFVKCIYYYTKYGESSKYRAWSHMGPELFVVQSTAILEIFHSSFKLVKASVLVSSMQFFARYIILFGLIVWEDILKQHPFTWWLFLTWSLSEVIRYPYYMLQILKYEIKLVTWLRYNAWLLLYPMGFILEGFIMLLALPLFQKSGRWSVELPNAANIAFPFTGFLKLYMLIMPFGFYKLMSHMYEARKKKMQISKPKKNKQTSKKKK